MIRIMSRVRVRLLPQAVSLELRLEVTIAHVNQHMVLLFSGIVRFQKWMIIDHL